MGQLEIDLLGTSKQGLGYILIVDGLPLQLQINDPASIDTTRNTLEATHTLTTGFKASKPEELAEELNQTLSVFFSPDTQYAFDILESTYATTPREVWIVFPVIPKLGGVTQAAAYWYLSAGQVASGSIAMPLGAYMTQEVIVTGGDISPAFKIQQPDTKAVGIDKTDIKTDVVLTGDLIATLAPTAAGTTNAPMIYELTGAGVDNDKVNIVGNQVFAAIDMTITSSAGANATYNLTITQWTLSGYDDQDADLSDIDVAVVYTVTS